MSDILLREREFIKLNAELDIKTKSVLGKPVENLSSLIKTSEEASRTNSVISKTPYNTLTPIEKKTNGPIGPPPSPTAKYKGKSKPPIKPRPWEERASTMPREHREMVNSLSRKIIRERELLKLNDIIENEAKTIMKQAQENIEDEITLEQIRSARDEGTGIPSPNEQSASSSSSSSISRAMSRRSSLISEVIQEEEISEYIEKSDETSNALPRPKKGNSTQSLKKPPLRPLPPVPDRLPKKNISSDGLIKFLKAKVAILQEELDTGTRELKKKIGDIENSNEYQKKVESQRDQAISKNNNLNEQVIKLEDRLTDLDRKLKQREAEFTATSREMESLKREVRHLTQANTSLEKRLYRANEDLENLKNNLASARDAEKEFREMARQEKDVHERQSKLLKKQRTELLTAYKKQLYLLDNLKRQNNCLEQARLITFAEKEFTKVLEWNTKN